MAKKDTQQNQSEQVSGGGHLGGTHFGQQPGDAKVKPHPKSGGRDDNTKRNDGKNS